MCNSKTSRWLTIPLWECGLNHFLECVICHGVMRRNDFKSNRSTICNRNDVASNQKRFFSSSSIDTANLIEYYVFCKLSVYFCMETTGSYFKIISISDNFNFICSSHLNLCYAKHRIIPYFSFSVRCFFSASHSVIQKVYKCATLNAKCWRGAAVRIAVFHITLQIVLYRHFWSQYVRASFFSVFFLLWRMNEQKLPTWRIVKLCYLIFTNSAHKMKYNFDAMEFEVHT